MASINFKDLFRVDRPDSEKAKRIICAIISANGGTLSGTTRLYKAFYAAHLFHWVENKGILSKYPIARMPKGPGIDAGERLLGEMRSEGLIQSEVHESGPYKETTYTLKECGTPLADDEMQAVRKAVQWVEGLNATQLSQVTHDFSRSWNHGADGDIIDIYADTLSDQEYERIKQCHELASDMVDSIFGGSNVGCSG